MVFPRAGALVIYRLQFAFIPRRALWLGVAAPRAYGGTEAGAAGEAEFCSRQVDAFEDEYGAWDPDGELADGETLEASWDDEAWDDPDA